MSKSSNSFPDRLSVCWVEIEEDRKVVVLAQTVSESIQDGFPLRSEATENKDTFRG